MSELEKGFYYHYKHDAEGPVNNYAYEVMGTAKHSEDGSAFVVYRPIRDSEYYKGFDFSVRPYDMFCESVEKDGVTAPRFKKITDPAVIAELAKIRDTMYRD